MVEVTLAREVPTFVENVDLEYFKSIRQEITDRIKIHYALLGTKLTIVGGVVSFLAKESLGVSPLLAASIFAFFFDVVLVENLGWIRGAGGFMKEHFEKHNFTRVEWEQHFAQPTRSTWCFDRWTYILGVWSIGFALLVIGVVGIWVAPSSISNSVCAAMSGLMGGYSFLVVWKNLPKHRAR